jgi:hypothetical protein
MKSTLVEAEVKKPEIKFPCIAVDDGGTVVLFTAPQKGTLVVLSPFSGNYSVGYYCEDWEPVTDSGWTIFPPGTKVELIQD